MAAIVIKHFTKEPVVSLWEVLRDNHCNKRHHVGVPAQGRVGSNNRSNKKADGRVTATERAALSRNTVYERGSTAKVCIRC